MSDPRVIVFGGYGTFGAHVSRELAARGVSVTVAGRGRERAEAFAARLDPPQRGLGVDVRDGAALRAALAGHAAAVVCAGPFSTFGAQILEGCLDAGCHYVDIADDRRYAALVREHGPRFRARGLTAAYGCSSLPTISCSAAVEARAGLAVPVTHARLTLFIGNDKPKGVAAVASAAALIGRRIDAPQGPLVGMAGRERVVLPAPFGPRRVVDFESPDYDLLPPLLGTPSMRVKVGFEVAAFTNAFALFAVAAPRLGRWLLPRLATFGRLTRGIGSTAGMLQAELFLADRTCRRVTVIARDDGQRMASLPAVFVAERLARGQDAPRGAIAGFEAFAPGELLALFRREGYDVQASTTQE